MFVEMPVFSKLLFTEDANLALNKSVWQISTSGAGLASRAVDGNVNSWYIRGQSCTHTNEGHVTPWLTVDLEQMYLIQKVKITNRGDCCGEAFLCRYRKRNRHLLLDLEFGKCIKKLPVSVF